MILLLSTGKMYTRTATPESLPTHEHTRSCGKPKERPSTLFAFGTFLKIMLACVIYAASVRSQDDEGEKPTWLLSLLKWEYRDLCLHGCVHAPALGIQTLHPAPVDDVKTQPP